MQQKNSRLKVIGSSVSTKRRKDTPLTPEQLSYIHAHANKISDSLFLEDMILKHGIKRSNSFYDSKDGIGFDPDDWYDYSMHKLSSCFNSYLITPDIMLDKLSSCFNSYPITPDITSNNRKTNTQNHIAEEKSNTVVKVAQLPDVRNFLPVVYIKPLQSGNIYRAPYSAINKLDRDPKTGRQARGGWSSM